MYKFDLKYSDLNTFTEELKYKCRIDIKSFTEGAAKRIIGGFMDAHKVSSVHDLINWINANPRNKDEFMKAIIPNKTEFFRDPGLWRFLEVELPKIVKSQGSVKVLDLGASSGQEVYSFSIMVNNLKLNKQVELVAVEKFQIKINQMLEGIYNDKEFESCENNYSRFKIGKSFGEFVSRESGVFKLKEEYITPIQTKQYDLVNDRAFGEFDIVLCRNVMCYISLKKARPVYKSLSDFTKKNGYLVLGVQEDLSNSFFNRDFNCVNEEFKVYQKVR